jgi:hypothetical protein
VLLPDGRSFILRTSRDENVRAMNQLAAGDGDAYRAGVGFVEQNAELIFAAGQRAVELADRQDDAGPRVEAGRPRDGGLFRPRHAKRAPG